MATSRDFFKIPLAEYDAFATYGSFQEQTDLVDKLTHSYDDISGQLQIYDDRLREVSSTTDRYKDFNKFKEKVNDTDIWLDKADRKLSVKDGVKDDIHIMILQQNNAYIVGMITLATVLITTYLVIK
jgi:hypothetical protein